MNWLARLKKVESAPAPTLQKLRNDDQGVSVVFVGACPEPFQKSVSENDTFTARLGLFTDRGLNMDEAEAMAARLVGRDREQDDRRLCLECLHLSGCAGGWRCSRWQMRQINSADIPGDLVTVVMHRCAMFNDRVEAIA
ncbi:MAG: hypothetical protein A3I66_12655 [Burkholderiales bacterium RIFCSPLOWO2_02_FULL_57_36]|nr:MAG: hypothetical protein A3I66_12655 [Burkholderiales bacterium RIFCSPLOWO2_02_FULL_57_36]